MRERDLIDWIRRNTPPAGPNVPIGPGDDTAMVLAGNEAVLVTVDQVLDGVHFELALCGGYLAGRKAMARNLSDIAAMAGTPLCAVVAVALPKGLDEAVARDIHRGIVDLATESGCPLVGGDVGTWPGALAISLTVLGRPGPWGPIGREGARAGDALLVTGRLGGAWRTERHLNFPPRLDEARALAQWAGQGLHAMIDLSDGLATDLGHICRAGGVGAELETGAIPLHEDAQLAGAGDLPLRAALSDGEDYELLLAVEAESADKLLAHPPRCGLTRVGRIVPGQGIVLIDPSGARAPMDLAGWEHQG